MTGIDMFAEFLDPTGADRVRLERLIPRWEELARHAAQPNVFHEHWSLLPALREFGHGAPRLLLVWENGDRRVLLALLPLCVECRFRGAPVPRTALWRHPYCYLSTPLLRAGRTAELWPEILRSIRAGTGWPRFTSFYRLGTAGGIVDALPRATGRRTTVRRAALHLEGGTHDRFLAGLRTKTRKEAARNWRRFQELGEAGTAWYGDGTPATLFGTRVERFLALEHASWKGERGTSLLSDPAHARYFRELLASGHRRGQVSMLDITLDGESMAMLAVLVSACGSCAYTFKIATSARYPRYSLGSRLVLQLTERAYATRFVELIDSCAAEDHPMIDRLWASRLEIVNLHFDNGNPLARWLVPVTDVALSLLRGPAR